jgi:hypothetical protein
MADPAAPPATPPATPRLSLADQALANMLGFLASQRIEDGRTALALEALAEIAPQLRPGLPVVQRLQDAAREVLAAAPGRRKPGRGSVAWCQAMLTASAAVSEFLFWRGALAVEALRRTQSPPDAHHGVTHAAE